jgi:hypothetical protein
MKWLILAAPVLVAVPSAASAVEQSDYLLKTAGNLAALCGAPDNMAAIHMCEGYLVGVNQMYAAISEALDGKIYCLPDDGTVTRDGVARDFSKWIAATPAAATMPARDGLLEWARMTYPCK